MTAPPTRGRLAAGAITIVVILVLVRSDLRSTTCVWLVPAFTGVVAAVVTTLPLLQTWFRPGWVPGVIAGVVAIEYLCVPETDQIPWTAVVPLSMGVVELCRGRVLSFWWVYGAAAVVFWAGIYGATGRESALVGALFAWWPLLAVPVVASARRRFAAAASGWFVVVVFVAAVAATVVARTGALQRTVEPALVAVAIAWPISAVVVVAIAAAVTAERGGRVDATHPPNRA